MARAFLLCGPVGSGKTTYATHLAANGAVRFSLDEWMIHFYGHHMTRELFEQRSLLCQQWILQLSESLLSSGVDVVLDWGFWDRQSRDAVRSRLAQWQIQLLLFDTPSEERFRRIEARNSMRSEGTFEITKEMFDLFETWFHPPAQDEQHELITP